MSALRRLFSFSLIQLVAELLVVVLVFVLIGLLPPLLLSLHFPNNVLEEGVFRGIIFRLLERAAGSWIAIAVSGLFFGAIHLLNPGATLMGALTIALTGGVMLAVAYMLTRSLWLAVGIHWAWDLLESSVFGVNESGARAVNPLFTSTTHGPQVWTGGSFGIIPIVRLIVCFSAGSVSLAQGRLGWIRFQPP